MTQSSLPHTPEAGTREPRQSPLWHMSEDDRRIAIAEKARRGARRALGRRDYIKVEPTPAPVYPVPQIEIPVGIRAWKRILYEVAIEHGIPVVLILGKQRQPLIVAARHHAMFRMSTETSMSMTEIGRRMGRDHSSVLHAVAKHKERMNAAV